MTHMCLGLRVFALVYFAVASCVGVWLFVCLFIRLFIHSFIHSFILVLIDAPLAVGVCMCFWMDASLLTQCFAYVT